jgi:hypothetical protein
MSSHVIVIPGRHAQASLLSLRELGCVASPESIITGLGLWIPALGLAVSAGMTGSGAA